MRKVIDPQLQFGEQDISAIADLLTCAPRRLVFA
jgi:hypothetical protein